MKPFFLLLQAHNHVTHEWKATSGFFFHTKKTEIMRPIQPEQMEWFYEGADSKSSVCLYAAVAHAWRGTCMVFVLYLKIKPGLFRSQCKSSYCGNQSGSPESRSYVRFCCLITGVCQNCVATVTKHSEATPLPGLQTLIHHANFLFFSLLSLKYRRVHVQS